MASSFSCQWIAQRAVRWLRTLSMGATTSARMTTVSAPATTATATARTTPRAEAPTFSTTPKNSSPMTRKMSPSKVSSTVCQLVREATR